MSTILEALRKLQREREQPAAADFRDSLTADSDVYARRRFPWLAVLSTFGIAGLAYGAWVFLVPMVWSPQQESQQQRTYAVPPASERPQPGGTSAKRTPPVPLRSAPAAPRQRTARPAPLKVPARGAPKAARDLPADPVVKLGDASDGPGLPPRRFFGDVSRGEPREPEPPRPADHPAEDAIAKPLPVAKAQPKEAPPRPALSEADGLRKLAPEKARAAGAAPEGARTIRAPEPKPEPMRAPAPALAAQPKPEPKPEPKLEPKPELAAKPPSNPFLKAFEPLTTVEKLEEPALSTRRAPGEADPDSESARVRGLFPELVVRSVRWHPDPERRVATLLLEQVRNVEVRQGDLVQGATVHRIDPGAVELKVGSARKRLRIQP